MRRPIQDRDAFVAKVRETFLYDPETGLLARRFASTRGSKRQGMFGMPTDKGYYRYRLNGMKYYAHFLVWVHYYGVIPHQEIDHADGNRANNAISNLRIATRSDQCCNRCVRSDNKLGVKGVCWDKQLKKYRVQVRIKGRRVHQSLHDNLEDAAAAYANAARMFHGEFSRHG